MNSEDLVSELVRLSPERHVTVAVVSYKTAALVCKSLAALGAERDLLRQRGIYLRAIIVDNASGDFSTLREFVETNELSEWISVIQAERNGGFAYGNNRILQRAYESGEVPDYFYLLNPDAEVRPRAILSLVEFLNDHSNVGIVGGSFEEPDGTPWLRAFRFPSLLSEINNGLQFGLATRLLRNHVVARNMGQHAEPVDWVSGAAMLIRRQVVEQLGGLDESYFLYFEETDFCRKTRGAGWDVWYVPHSRVMHSAGTSTGLGHNSSQPTRLPGYWFESRRRYFAKNHGIPSAVAIDVTFLLAQCAGLLKSYVLGRMDERTPQYTSDLLRHSILWPRNQTVLPAREYRPPSEARRPTDPVHRV